MNAIKKYGLTEWDNFGRLPEDMQGKDIRKVSASNLNARVVPEGSKCFLLSAGDSVNVVEEKNGWCKIEAWVSAQYLVK